MPLKIYVFISLLSIAGAVLIAFMFMRGVRAWRSEGWWCKLREGALFFLLIGFAFALASTFLPCFSFGGGVFCHGPHEKWITLTFDDGPNEPYTSQILDILKRYHISATFFLVGKNIQRYPQVVRRIVEEGHVIGNHTYDHAPLVFMDTFHLQQEIERWEQALQPIASVTPQFFRAPHGWKNPLLYSVLKEKGYRLIGWTVGVWDSDQPGKEVLLSRLTGRLQKGMILLLHDGEGSHRDVDRGQTVAVLPNFIEYCQRQGFQFVELQRMLDNVL